MALELIRWWWSDDLLMVGVMLPATLPHNFSSMYVSMQMGNYAG